jgi:hypothetical protein
MFLKLMIYIMYIYRVFHFDSSFSNLTLFKINCFLIELDGSKTKS